MAQKPQNNRNLLWMVLIIVLFIACLIIFINRDKAKKVAAKIFAAIKDQSTIYGDNRDLNFNQALNPNYANPNSYNQEQKDTALQIAKKIHGAKGYITDDENAVYAAIQEAGSKKFLSLVSRQFLSEYKVAMIDYLQDGFLNTTELDRVKTLISQLP